MGLEKNFVVKKGIEVATDLVFADTPTNRVGVGTTQPTRKLDVNGDFQAVGDAKVVGIATVDGKLDIGAGGTAFRVDTPTNRVGINTQLDGSLFDFEVIGDVGFSTNLKVGGITTSSNLIVTGLIVTKDLHAVGLSTIAHARIEAGFTTVTYSEAQYLNVTGVGTAVQFDATDVNVSGIATVNRMHLTTLNVSGVSTFVGNVNLNANLDLQDNDKILLGTDDDLEIYHDGTNSYINDNGTGDLIVRGSVVRVGGAGTTEDMIVATQDSGVSLYFDNSKKLETLDTGIDVTGLVDADSLNISGNGNITGVVTVGVITDVSAMTVSGDLFANSFRGDGSLITGLDTSGNFSGKTIVCQNVFSTGPGVGTFGSVSINNPAGRITATEYYGDGANITNAGATLSAASGVQRLVTTSLTSAKMTTAGTDADLTFDASTNTLSCTNFSGNGSSISNVNAVTVDGIDSSQFIRSDANDNVTGHTEWQDSKQVRLGSDADLKIYHNGTNSFIDNNTSHIYIRNNVNDDDGGNIYLQAKADENGIIVNDDGSVELYHNNAQKLVTSTTGVTVTGTLVATTFSGSGASLTSIPNGALNNSTISGIALGSNLTTLTSGSYITGSNYNGSTARTWAVDASTGNTGGKIVARDGSGNFSAGTITASLNGTALNSTNINVAADNSTNATHYITFTGSATGNQKPNSDTGLTYNPSTNTITATNFAGNATTATNATNAGTVDGLNASDFIRSNADDNVTGHTEWQDSKQVRFGNDADMRIYHSGSDAYIDNNTRHIYIRSNVDNDDGGNIYLQAKSGENGIIVNDDSSVSLYHDNVQKLTTSTGGVTITGTLTASSGASISGTVTGTTFSGSGASLSSLNASNLSSGTVNTARLPSSYSKSGAVTVETTGASSDLTLRSYDHVFIQGGTGEDGAIYFRGNSGADSYRFSKSGQTTHEGFLSFESLSTDRTYTFPNSTGTIALTSSTVSNANTVGSISPGSFLRSDATDTASGALTFNGRVSIRGSIDISDSQNVDFGSSDDVRINYNPNNWLYFDFRTGAGIIFQDNGSNKVRLEDSGIFRPESTNTGTIGSSSYYWDNGYFQDFNVSSTINVRGAIDLADNDILRFGSSDDVEFFFDGSHFYLDLNAGGNNFYIRDTTTTRFTFNDNGAFTATGKIKGSGFDIDSLASLP